MIARRPLLLGAALLAAVAASVWSVATTPEDLTPMPRAPRTAGPDDRLASLGASPKVQGPAAPRSARGEDWRLPDRSAAGRPSRDAFADLTAPPPPVASARAADPAPPAAPPVPFTYAGHLEAAGETQYLLAEGLRTHMVPVGGEASGFRLDSAGDTQLVFTHVATGQPQTLVVNR